jgi:hypothetical protein
MNWRQEKVFVYLLASLFVMMLAVHKDSRFLMFLSVFPSRQLRSIIWWRTMKANQERITIEPVK